MRDRGWRWNAGAALGIGCALFSVTGCAQRSVTSTAPVRPPAAVAKEAPPVRSAPVDEPRGVWHVVRPGETLWRIARTYGTGVDQLAEINRIAEPTRLEVDTPLWIPGATHPLEVPGPPATSVAKSGWIWPVRDGKLLSSFGAPRRTHRHTGLDIGGRPGQPVRASRGGKVIYSGSGMRGYGKTIILDHGDDIQSLYAHNATLLVAPGDRVSAGQTIARVGRTGNATTEHCHFEIRRRNVPVDPMGYLPGEATR